MTTDTLRDIATGDKAKNPVVAFSNFLDKLKPQLSLALPKHLTADRMARLALSEFSKNEKLQACEPKTIAASIMAASTMGLEIGVGGQGFLVPYGRTCTFVPGWMGLVDLVNRSGNATVYTGVIFADQKYRFVDGSSRQLEILNETDMDGPNDITHAYAVGWVKGASMPVIELWRVSKVTKHRDKYNKVGKSHYSYRDFEMYARKVVLLQVLKYMPKSIEMQRAMAASDAAERGESYTIDGDFVTVDPSQQGAPEQIEGREVDPPAPAATTREPLDNDEQKTYAQVEEALRTAKTTKILDQHRAAIVMVRDDLQDELQKVYAARLAQLEG